MAKVDSWKCDICGTVKRDANRWWKAYRLAEASVTVSPWDIEEPDVWIGDEPAHLCGESCVVQWLSKHVLGVGQ